MNSQALNTARKYVILALVASILSLGAATAFAAEDIVESARISCQKDIDSYCKDVTRGEGRILQCLSAHEDKISDRCTYAVNDASLQVQRVALAIKYVATECKSDLEKHCSDIPIGDGRIAQCLKKNSASLAPSCQQSLKDTRMEIK